MNGTKAELEDFLSKVEKIGKIIQLLRGFHVCPDQQIRGLVSGEIKPDEIDEEIARQARLKKDRELWQKQAEEKKRFEEEKEKVLRERGKLYIAISKRGSALTLTRRVEQIIAKHQRREERRAKRAEQTSAQQQPGPKSKTIDYEKWNRFSVRSLLHVRVLCSHLAVCLCFCVRCLSLCVCLYVCLYRTQRTRRGTVQAGTGGARTGGTRSVLVSFRFSCAVLSLSWAYLRDGLWLRAAALVRVLCC